MSENQHKPGEDDPETIRLEGSTYSLAQPKEETYRLVQPEESTKSSVVPKDDTSTISSDQPKTKAAEAQNSAGEAATTAQPETEKINQIAKFGSADLTLGQLSIFRDEINTLLSGLKDEHSSKLMGGPFRRPDPKEGKVILDLPKQTKEMQEALVEATQNVANLSESHHKQIEKLLSENAALQNAPVRGPSTPVPPTGENQTPERPAQSAEEPKPKKGRKQIGERAAGAGAAIGIALGAMHMWKLPKRGRTKIANIAKAIFDRIDIRSPNYLLKRKK